MPLSFAHQKESSRVVPSSVLSFSGKSGEHGLKWKCPVLNSEFLLQMNLILNPLVLRRLLSSSVSVIIIIIYCWSLRTLHITGDWTGTGGPSERWYGRQITNS